MLPLLDTIPKVASTTNLQDSSPVDNAIPSRLPPSPPSSDKSRRVISRQAASILRLFRQHEKGLLPSHSSPWLKRRLLPEEYIRVLADLEGDEQLKSYVEEEIRYDYDAATQYITIRMPPRIHESFIEAVAIEIYTQIQRLSQENIGNTALHHILNGIRVTGSPDITLGDRFADQKDAVTKRSPDKTFQHDEAVHPAVVMEVSYSQKRKDLPRLADSYMMDSKFNIKCVVGLDIEYKRRGRDADEERAGEAVVSIWRPGTEEEGDEIVDVCKQVVENDVFRSGDRHSQQGSLVLMLADFVPTLLLSRLPEAERNLRIEIPYTTLAEFLSQAEKTQVKYEKGEGLLEPEPKNPRKRKLTPDPELSDGREAAFHDLEEANARKASDAESNYEERGNEALDLQTSERRRSRRRRV
ncbi:hypothetical protein B0A49_14008 [Cryomyces minteri]|uniref:Uncharacterized protein n=1 Tax=Cryomyces minteri TaxID=331657 RepID=A0A4U0WID7_9PEZI|nr:hypothetical protein B0A49_14008 [Cryomyces minteri]